MTDQPIPVKVVESPAEALRRLALVEDLPREDLWKAIAASVLDINERIDVVERNAAENRRVMASIDNRLRWPRPETHRPPDTATQAIDAHEANQAHDGGHERPDPRGTVGTG